MIVKRIICFALFVLAGMTLHAQTSNNKSPFLTHELLLELWNEDQQSNRGYVWTINIHSGTEIIVEDLIETTYAMHLSMSHIGPTMNGVYKGVMGISAARDTKGFRDMLSALGGKMTTNGDIDELESDEYVFDLNKFDTENRDIWNRFFGYDALTFGMTAESKEIVDDMFKTFFGTYVRRSKPFESTMLPVAFGSNFELPKGSYGSFQKAQINIKNGLFSTAVTGQVDLGIADEKEKLEQSWGRVNDFLGGSHAINYENKTVSPVPHTITVYPNNVVVFELFSSEGGPVTAKFYGTITKTPVGNTITATKKSIKKSQNSVKPTDDNLEQQRAEAQAVLNARKAELQAAEEAKIREKKAAEQKETNKSDAEALKAWKEKFPGVPVWNGGSNYDINIEDTYLNFSATTDVDLVPSYVERLRAAGFKKQKAKSKFNDEVDNYTLYKVINGKYIGFMPDPNGWFGDGRNSFLIYVLDESGIARVKREGEK